MKNWIALLMFSAGSLAANRDPGKNLPLTRDEKTRIVHLIETQLFEKEMQEYDRSSHEVQRGYITIPELFAVLAFRDPLHSDEEDRFILIGNSTRNRLIVVVHTERGENVRIISARKATKKERKQYEENAQRSRHA